jgi:transposase
MTVNYAESLQQTVTLEDCLPPEHLVRFIVGIIALLDLSRIYAHYAPVGGEAIAPEILLGVLLSGYATGVFSSRKLEKATYESIPFRFVAGGLHPDHSTLAEFRKTFLTEITELFVQVLVVAHEAGVLHLGNISLDGSKIHADASKSNAVSYGRVVDLRQHLQAEIEELLALGEKADQTECPTGMNVTEEILLRQVRLTHLDTAKAILEMRAKERHAAEQAEYEAHLRAREAKAHATGHKPRGRAPQPPTPGPRDTDQYNFTDPESRIMKNSTNDGFDQHYNVQAAVEQDSMLIVAT